MQSTQDYIEMRLPASAEYVSLIRLTLSGVFSRAGASYDDIEDSKIAVSEAVTNAVKHAYKKNSEIGMINLCFEIFDDRIKIVISDQGESFDYEATKSHLGPYNDNENIDFLREGGLGLFLIESLMDEVTVYKESGVTISMIKYIKKEQVQHQENEDSQAQDKLVKHYRKLIESLAYRYSKGQSHHEDLVQVGMVGLIGAINRFDLSFDRKFEAFLVPTVIGEIKRYLRDKTWSVHVPRRIKEIGPRIKKVSDELTNELERSPSISEIAQRLEVSDEEVLEAMEMGQSYNALSVDHSIEADKDGSTVTLLDIMGQQDDNYDLTEKRMILERILPILSERERQIIQCTFIEGLSQKETGERIGLSQMHVSRLQRTVNELLTDLAIKSVIIAWDELK
ncbi:MAG: RNA polymerase sigma factor SigB [Staphylococcus epidermidis]|nr:RNA polymerase sigma factor SigB [Staphylococcus epidermidis]